MGLNDSLLEWGPKRPPRRQKSPVGSGTSKVATEYGVRSEVTSTMNESWRISWHSLRSDSETSSTKSRVRPGTAGDQCGTEIPRIGKLVCPPQAGDMSRRPIWG